VYCPRCRKKGIKVSMKTNIKEKEYVCRRCGYIVKWFENE